MVIFIIAPILIIMAALAEPLFRFLFTDKSLPAVPYFQILCIAGTLYPMHAYNLNILSVKGRSDLFLRLEIIKKILVAVILAVSFFFGIYGLLWGQVISSFLAFFINTHYSGKFLKYNSWEQLWDITPILLLAAVMGSVVYFINNELAEFSDFIRLLIGAILGITFFLSFARIFRFDSGKTVSDLLSSKMKISIPFKFNRFS